MSIWNNPAIYPNAKVLAGGCPRMEAVQDGAVTA
jgi:hypothetical protein